MKRCPSRTLPLLAILLAPLPAAAIPWDLALFGGVGEEAIGKNGVEPLLQVGAKADLFVGDSPWAVALGAQSFFEGKDSKAIRRTPLKLGASYSFGRKRSFYLESGAMWSFKNRGGGEIQDILGPYVATGFEGTIAKLGFFAEAYFHKAATNVHHEMSFGPYSHREYDEEVDIDALGLHVGAVWRF